MNSGLIAVWRRDQQEYEAIFWGPDAEYQQVKRNVLLRGEAIERMRAINARSRTTGEP